MTRSCDANGLTVRAAIADADLNQGQAVGLKMKNGLLFAVNQTG